MVELMSKRKQELEQSYRETIYSVFIENKQYDITVGKPLPTEIQQLVNKEKTAVILTAWNPRSQELPLEENKSRNIELNEKLQSYIMYTAVGQGKDLNWTAEESFFILGISEKEAEILAVKFEQYAYVWFDINKEASLVFTNIWLTLHSDS